MRTPPTAGGNGFEQASAGIIMPPALRSGRELPGAVVHALLERCDISHVGDHGVTRGSGFLRAGRTVDEIRPGDDTTTSGDREGAVVAWLRERGF